MVSALSRALTVKPYSSAIDCAKASPSAPVFATTVLPSRSAYPVMESSSAATAICTPESKYGSEKSKIFLRSSVMDMPAMTPSAWPAWTAWRAASKPSAFTSTSKPWRSATSFMRSTSMPVMLPEASRNSNGAKVVSVAMTNVSPLTPSTCWLLSSGALSPRYCTRMSW